MSWRTVVVTGNAKLDYKIDYLVVRKAIVAQLSRQKSKIFIMN